MRYKTKWDRGDKTKLAKAAGISPQYLCDIMAGRKECRAKLAIELEQAALTLGYRISRFQWSFTTLRTNNPLFPTQNS